MLSLRASSCRALGAAAVAGTRASVLGRRHYLAPSLLAGLSAYSEHFDHVRVPQKFVVPDAEGWPEEARGLKLGLQVTGLRQRVALLLRSQAAHLQSKLQPVRLHRPAV